jgi:NitT/TauT family transport system ATP-binding protein
VHETATRIAAMDTPAPGAVTAKPPAEPILAVRGLGKTYRVPTGQRVVFESIDLDVSRGELVCVVGPSGAGKTTLLRCMSGLLAPSTGQVLLAGEPIVRPPQRLAVVFQDYSRSLLPWLSVEANVILPLRGKGRTKDECHALAGESLRAVGLEKAARQYPWQLSGGMQQRVAIARALAYQPSVLLMDEPFASVDAQTRADLEDLTLGLRRSFDVTIVLVTHDIDESVYLGDRVVVLSGTPTRVHEEIAIDLPGERDQLQTKALPRFAQLRARVLRMIRTDGGTANEPH